MVDIAIIDDNIEFTVYLEKLIKEIRMIDSFDIDVFTSPINFLNKDKNYNIILLDIDMPEIDGITLAKKIYKTNSLIIYITNYDNKMASAFFVNVFKYITKDRVEFELEEVLKEAILFIQKNSIISAKTDLGLKNFNSTDIVYLQYLNRSISVYTKNKKYITYITTLEEIQSNLPSCFIKVNRNTIVNGMYIEYYFGNEIKMYFYDKEIKVSRRKKEEVIKMIFGKVNKI